MRVGGIAYRSGVFIGEFAALRKHAREPADTFRDSASAWHVSQFRSTHGRDFARRNPHRSQRKQLGRPAPVSSRHEFGFRGSHRRIGRRREPSVFAGWEMAGVFCCRQTKKISLDGGSPVVIAEGISNPKGLSWGTDHNIYYAPSLSSGILRVSDSGGTPQPVTKLQADKGELADFSRTFSRTVKRCCSLHFRAATWMMGP